MNGIKINVNKPIKTDRSRSIISKPRESKRSSTPHRLGTKKENAFNYVTSVRMMMMRVMGSSNVTR